MALMTTQVRVVSSRWTLVATAVTDVAIAGTPFGYSVYGGTAQPAASAIGVPVYDKSGVFELSGLAASDQVYARLNGPDMPEAVGTVTVMSK